MLQGICRFQPLRKRKFCSLLLASSWLLGLLCGIGIYLTSDASTLPLMRTVISSPVSIVRLLLVTTFPFLISAAFMALSMPLMLLPICFFKTATYAYLAGWVLDVFGSAGWLVQGLLLFSGSATLPLLYGFCLQCMKEDNTSVFWDLCPALGFSILIGCVDYRIISPFLAHLISH